MTVVFLHPIGLDRHCWRFLPSDTLAGSACLDLLGHGDRGLPPGDLTLAAMADDVVARVPGDLDLVGLSLGGAVAQYVAIRHPGRVRSLVIAASSPGGGDGSVQEQRARRLEQHGIEPDVDDTLRRWFTERALADRDHRGVAYARRCLLADDPRAFAAAWRALGRCDTIDRLPAVTAPTTVLHADQDRSGGIEAKIAMARALPRSRLVTIAGPHLVHLENPRAFDRALHEHLAWSRQRGPDVVGHTSR